ncbi:hypothetical protein [Kosakonia sp. S42]|uniref:hypothetical protein n=1 Tax=Kosakonia sp. S42 TaxID=2767458 RepID=UPI00190E3C6D|nr:hypothetical protein [Kosakonia sp. S42]
MNNHHIRLTPLERNGWQVLRMLRTTEGISPLVNLGQLRRYLTSTPLGQRAGMKRLGALSSCSG